MVAVRVLVGILSVTLRQSCSKVLAVVSFLWSQHPFCVAPTWTPEAQFAFCGFGLAQRLVTLTGKNTISSMDEIFVTVGVFDLAGISLKCHCPNSGAEEIFSQKLNVF